VTSPWLRGDEKDSGRSGMCSARLTWMPHAINMEVFNGNTSMDVGNDRDRDRSSRHSVGKQIGCVATNQIRKNWGLIGEVCAILRQRIPNLRLWFHIDVDTRHWSLPAILEDFGLQDITEVTHAPIEDRELAARYRACDVTLHPGEGEGWAIQSSNPSHAVPQLSM